MILSTAKNRKGFTLIEVLLALAIFTIIGIATVRQIQQIMDTKAAAFSEMDIYDGARTAISMMGNDLTQAFHVLYDDLGVEAKQTLTQNGNVAHTLFDGRKNEMVFTSLSHRVYYENRRETQQTEISYFLQTKNGANLPSLMKRDSGVIDADLYQGGPIYTLLDNVAELQFHYWDNRLNKWVDDWNSDGGDKRDRFPQSVKILLTVVGGANKRLTVETEVKIAYPNNEPVLVQF